MSDFSDYQKQAATTALYPGRDAGKVAPYPALGLAGEAGEVAEHVKKAIRDDGGLITPARRDALKKELGDVLWYVAALCTELDLDMADVARANLDKLASRKARGTLQGSGDNR